MDVVIGRIAPTGGATEKPQEGPAPIEARLLHVRPPRRRPPASDRGTRAPGSTAMDPPGARVLVLLVPDAYRLPDDLSKHRVFLRFVKR
jgi:hypothetical protein